MMRAHAQKQTDALPSRRYGDIISNSRRFGVYFSSFAPVAPLGGRTVQAWMLCEEK